MSETVLTVDPEVEGILKEVAADPRSSLLRIPRPTSVRAYLERYPLLETSASGLTKAEAHLLRVHRSEVAWLFKEVCKLRLASDPNTGMFLSRRLGPTSEVRILDEGEIRSRAKAERSLPQLDEGEWNPLVARCAQDPLGAAVSTGELAAVSLRLEPSDSARICLGLDLVFRDRARAALEVFKSILHGDPDDLIASIALEDMGLAYSALGEHVLALRSHRAASHRGKPRAVPALWWLLSAMLAGAEADAIQASKRWQDLHAGEEGFVSRFILLQKERRRLGRWSPSPESRVLCKQLRAELPESGRRIVDDLFV